MNSNHKTLESFIDRSDPKQFALVGLQALGVLAETMSAEEFNAFLHDAVAVSEKGHIAHIAQRMLTDDEVQRLMKRGAIREYVKENQYTDRLIGHNGQQLGRIKSTPALIFKGK